MTVTDPAPPKRHLRVFEGLLPFDKARFPAELVAGVTLAALAIPEVMGYTQIAGMPVVTGLYTILLPVFVFAVLGSSRHLVVGADSATAAIMYAGLVPLAAVASPQYVALAGLLALMTGVLLLIARLIGLGFLADFLSRTVLVGFLTGVGIQVAMGQVAGMLGVPKGSGGTLRSFAGTLANIGETSLTTLAVALSVIAVTLGTKFISKKVPGALIAVVGSIFVSWAFDLSSHGVAIIGPLPGGLPSVGIPNVSWSDIPPLFGIAVSIVVLVLAQSAATSRAYAARYGDAFSENVDLVGLAGASVAAGMTGAFPVNGSPTKTQMVDGAGGRSQVAQLTTGVLVIIVLLFLTVPIQYLPKAVLAAVVFIIGCELVDLGGLRSIARERPDEFIVAVLTGATVVVIGVEQGIILAIAASVVAHLRRSYKPNDVVLVPEADGEFEDVPTAPDARTLPGLVVYRFAAALYYANANRFFEEMVGFATSDTPVPVRWIVLDARAIPDIDYTGADTLRRVVTELSHHGVKLVLVAPMAEVRAELDVYGITPLLGEGAYFHNVADAVEEFRNTSV